LHVVVVSQYYFVMADLEVPIISAQLVI